MSTILKMVFLTAWQYSCLLIFGNLRDVCVIDDASIREQRQVIKAAQDSIKPLEEQNATQGQ